MCLLFNQRHIGGVFLFLLGGRLYLENDRLSCLLASGDQEELCRAFYLIAENLGRMYRVGDDEVQDAVLNCWRGSKTFKQGKAKAFTYFTTIVKNCYRRSWKRRERDRVRTNYDWSSC